MVIKQFFKSFLVLMSLFLVFAVSAARKKIVGKKAEELLTASASVDEVDPSNAADMSAHDDSALVPVSDQDLLNQGSLKDLALKTSEKELELENLTSDSENDQQALALGDEAGFDATEFDKMMKDMMENPEAMKEMEKMMQDPEILAQVDAMMKDPEAMKQMEEMMKSMESGQGLDFSKMMGDQNVAASAA